MTDLNVKPGWRKVKFGQVVRLSKARCADPLAEGIERYVGLEHLEPGDLRIRSWGNVADGVTFTSVFNPGQVLFGKRRAYQRKVAVAEFSGVCSGDIYVLESQDTNVLLPELLPFICQTEAFFEHAVGTSAGSLSPRTNWTSLADFEFAVPSISEQKKAVALLAAIADMKDALVALRDSAWTLLESRLADVFSLGENPFNEPRNTNFPCKRLAELIKVRHGWPFKSECFSTEEKSGPLLLTPSNFAEAGEFNFAPERNKYYLGEFPEEYRLKSGALAVLMTDLTPTARLLGAPGMVSANTEVLQNQRIGVVIPVSDSIMVRYLFFFFLSDSFRRLVRAQSAGSTVSHTSPTQICRIPIPLPSLGDQQSLTAEFDQLFNVYRSAESRLRDVVSLSMVSREQILG